jgi:hypothetical protein
VSIIGEPTPEYVADLARGTLQEWFQGYVPAEDGVYDEYGQSQYRVTLEEPTDDAERQADGSYTASDVYRFAPADERYRQDAPRFRITVTAERIAE